MWSIAASSIRYATQVNVQMLSKNFFHFSTSGKASVCGSSSPNMNFLGITPPALCLVQQEQSEAMRLGAWAWEGSGVEI